MYSILLTIPRPPVESWHEIDFNEFSKKLKRFTEGCYVFEDIPDCIELRNRTRQATMGFVIKERGKRQVYYMTFQKFFFKPFVDNKYIQKLMVEFEDLKQTYFCIFE